MTNSQQLRIALEKLELSQVQFAVLLEVSTKTVSLWANNKSPTPRVVMLYLELRLRNLDIAKLLAE